MKTLKTYWFHILVWLVMFVYFLFAPDWFALTFLKVGKPLQTDGVIPAESKRITFVVEDLQSYIVDGANLYNLYGWAYIVPEKGETSDSYIREIVLSSEQRNYFFGVKLERRDPGLQSLPADTAVNLNTLGFDTLIAEDTIKPGKYRIGIIFKDTTTGKAFYWDKPARYLIKTPNTLKFSKN